MGRIYNRRTNGMSWPAAETAIRLDLGSATADASLIPSPGGGGAYLNLAHVLTAGTPGTGLLTYNNPGGTAVWQKAPSDVDPTCIGWADMVALDATHIWVAARNAGTGMYWAKFNLLTGVKSNIGGGVSTQSGHNGAFLRLTANELHAYTDGRRFRYSATTGALLAEETITLTSGYQLPGVPSYLPANLKNVLLRVPTSQRVINISGTPDGTESPHSQPLLVARNARTAIEARLERPGAFGIYARDHTANRTGLFVQYPGGRWMLVCMMSPGATAKNEIVGSRLFTESSLDAWLERICNTYRT